MSDSIRAVIGKLEGKLTEEDFLVEVGKSQERIRILDILQEYFDQETFEAIRKEIK